MCFKESFLVFCAISGVFSQKFDRIADPGCTPEGFFYIYVDSKSEWVGLGWAWTRMFSRLHNITLDVDYATAPLQNTTDLGTLKFLNFYSVKNPWYDKRWNMVYELIFPIQDPLPHATKIVLNGDTLCENLDSAFNPEKPDLVQMRLTYNDYTKEQNFTAKLVKNPTPIPETTEHQSEKIPEHSQENEIL